MSENTIVWLINTDHFCDKLVSIRVSYSDPDVPGWLSSSVSDIAGQCLQTTIPEINVQ